MGIDAISSIGNISQLDPLSGVQSQPQAAPAASSSGTSTSISEFGSAMNELGQLQQNDPTRFKEVMSSIADTLQGDASSATGQHAQFLGQVASDFQQAAQTGSMPPLQQPGSASGHHGGHHHHHAGVQSYQAQQSSSADPSRTGQQTPFDLAQVIQNALQQVNT